jgi:hypothetical protein
LDLEVRLIKCCGANASQSFIVKTKKNKRSKETVYPAGIGCICLSLGSELQPLEL